MAKFTYNDVSFNTATELGRYLSIEERTVSFWLSGKSGDVTEYINGKLHNYNSLKEHLKQFSEIFGRDFNSLKDLRVFLQDEYDVRYASVELAVGKENIAEFISLAIKNNHLFILRGTKPFVYDGMDFKTIKKFYSHYSIESTSFKQKYLETKGNIEKSISTANYFDYSFKKLTFEVDGKLFNSARELAEFYNIHPDSFLGRYKKGQPIKEIIESLQSLDRVKMKGISNITYNGVLYKNKTHLMEGLRLTLPLVNEMINKSETKEDFIQLLDEHMKNKSRIYLKGQMFDENVLLRDFLAENLLLYDLNKNIAKSGLDMESYLEGLVEYYKNHYIIIGGVKFYTPYGLIKHTKNGFDRYIFKYIDTSTRPNDSDSEELKFLLERSLSLRDFYYELGGVGEATIRKLSSILKADRETVRSVAFSRSPWDTVKEALTDNILDRIDPREVRFTFINGESLDLISDRNKFGWCDKIVNSTVELERYPTKYSCDNYLKSALQDDLKNPSIDYVYGFKDFILKVFPNEIESYYSTLNSNDRSLLLESLRSMSKECDGVGLYELVLKRKFFTLNEVSAYFNESLNINLYRVRDFVESELEALEVLSYLKDTPFEFIISNSKGPFSVGSYRFNSYNEFLERIEISGSAFINELSRNKGDLLGAFLFARTYRHDLRTRNYIVFKGNKYKSIYEIISNLGLDTKTVIKEFLFTRDLEKAIDNLILKKESKISTNPLD